MVKEITDQEFEKEVLESKVPVLVDIFAAWCGPCRMLSPIIDGLAVTVGDKAKVVKMDADKCKTASQYGVTALPTVLIFENGQVINTMVGVNPPANYLKELDV